MITKPAIEKVIDGHFQGVKQRLLVFGAVKPEAFFFFHYKNNPDMKSVPTDIITNPDRLPDGVTTPREDPASKEMIGYYVCEANTQYSVMFPYSRRTGQIAFELKRLEDLTVIGGTFTKLFPKTI